MDERFDRIEARLSSIWIDRITRWSERMDVLLSKMDARLRENGGGPPNPPSAS